MLSYKSILLYSSLALQVQATVLQFTNPNICCSLLDSKFPGHSKVFSSSAPEYNDLTFYWTPTARVAPRCVFTPHNTNDVKKAVKLFARRNCQFAVRSGGHSYNPGWAGIKRGVLISLGNMNHTSYNTQTGLATVEGGSRWTDVYGALLPYNVTVLGGRNSDLGVGGYLTGGGISFYANKEGWAADNIASVEIVLGNGTVINADRTHHSDLLRSIKGGSNNFGIITKFRLMTVDATGIFNGWYMRYPLASTDAYLAAAEAYCNGGVDTDTKSHIIFSASIVGTNPMTNVALMAYDGVLDPLSPPTVLEPFFDGTVANATFQWFAPNGTIKSATDGLRDAQGSGNRYTMTTVSIQVELSLLKKLRAAWLEMTTQNLKTTPGFLVQFAFQPVGATWIAASEAKGGNSMGITEPLAVMWIQLRWDHEEDDNTMLQYSRRLIRRFERIASRAGKLANFRYLNYGDRFHKDDIIPSYGSESVTRLQNTKALYDPQNVFGRLVPGGFKVPGY
ncbi:hypothetical protein EYR41_009075 [Orbilia oligospora]|uniref:Uncharacterized protein n=1 Tax=Orbilia oligospora TaxID=2813651 RepID=A0A7C8PIE9_ORBOL|nr:hypothetical protein TWF751_007386 [Orbilia oligospora]TGJ65075.1 hypothetical protein EYR41_009075 [Orbilia oligospora]